MLKTLIGTNSNFRGALLVRIPLGIIFFAHGAQKLFGWFGGHGLAATAGFFAGMGLTPGLLWATLDACGEFFGGILVFFGLFTRLGALMIAIAMSVAILKVHWGMFFLPHGMEFPLVLLGAAIALIIEGGGRFSADSAIQKKLNDTKRP